MGDSGGDVPVRGREEERQRRRSAVKFYSEREEREVRGRRRRRRGEGGERILRQDGEKETVWVGRVARRSKRADY